MYCMDTDVIVDFLRNRTAVVEKVKKLSSFGVATTSLNVCELYKGVYLSEMPENESTVITEFLKKIDVLGLDEKSCALYGRNFALLKKPREQTQEFDLLIACICASNGHVLITRNARHFRNVPGLKYECW